MLFSSSLAVAGRILPELETERNPFQKGTKPPWGQEPCSSFWCLICFSPVLTFTLRIRFGVSERSLHDQKMAVESRVQRRPLQNESGQLQAKILKLVGFSRLTPWSMSSSVQEPSNGTGCPSFPCPIPPTRAKSTRPVTSASGPLPCLLLQP